MPSEPSIADLAIALGSLVRRIRSTAPPEARDLSWTQRAVLGRLVRDGPATIAELARAENVKPQSMGTAIASLADMGLVERRPHPTDGRQVNIVPTTKGTAIRRATTEAKHTWLAQAIAKLSKQDRAKLFAAGDVIKQLVEL